MFHITTMCTLRISQLFDPKIFGLLCFLNLSCKQSETLFEKLTSENSGIQFVNNIDESASSKSFINEFGYMGGGVGIGDFNNDGLKDIVFTANQGSCRIYLNKGNLAFEDITEKAGLSTNVWATGVSIADVNADGYDDIYICTYGKNLLTPSPNLLYINKQNLQFKEEAVLYGLADTSYSSQSVFFDYDRDGDLDVYIATYAFNSTNTSANNIVSIDTSGNSIANDKLYRNDGDIHKKGHPTFSDVSIAAGIKENGYGLGVSVSDLNNDGWPDIYVANDFVSNDRLWLNQKNGSFINIIDQSIQHQSYSSMGVDAADINNDGWQDIVTLDMLPEDNERRKTSFLFMNYDRYKAERFIGYGPEFMRNMLQLNNGNRPFGDSLPYFSEIGQMAGIPATDWSWSVLMTDFDLDGWKDMHITNGVGRDFINADFLEFTSQMTLTNLSKEERQKAIRDKLSSLDHVLLPNYFYKNNHANGFVNESKLAGIAEPSMSNGAAYADLDNDGDMDIVVNNINEKAFVWINQVNSGKESDSLHYLKIKLVGRQGNKHGIGSKISVYQGQNMQVCEQYPARGYYSSVDFDPIFGLGKNATIDSLVVKWPDGSMEKLLNPISDQTLLIEQKNAKQPYILNAGETRFIFCPMDGNYLNGFTHTEYEFNDFAKQRLLPQKFSQLGPYIANSDVNGDGLEDFFVGGAAYQNGVLFTQTQQGNFTSKEIKSQSRADQLNSTFFDADKDNDPDILVTYGDLQSPPVFPDHRPRLFLNDGKGNFMENPGAFSDTVACIAGTISVSDIDADGDQDIFLGARVSDRFPIIPQSFFLRNDGGRFTDVTAIVCPELKYAGMVTSSLWTDLDGDNQPEFVVTGDWMPVRIFKNKKGKLIEQIETGIASLTGMWRALAAADIDNDGDKDLIAGNLGRNNIYNCNAETPMELYAADIDGNGIIDPLHFYHILNKAGKFEMFPGISRAQFSEQVPSIKKKYLFAKDYARANINDILSLSKSKYILKLNCNETSSCIFENLGNGKFQRIALPPEAQMAPVNAIICTDIDNDGINDLILAGNEYQAEVFSGRYDASFGCFLKGTLNNKFLFVQGRKSGLILEGDVKDLEMLNTANGDRLLVAAINSQPLKVLRINRGSNSLEQRSHN